MPHDDDPGVADLDDAALRERIAGLKVVRDQSRVDADRAQAMLESTGERAITPEMVGRLSQAARERLRLDRGRLSAGSPARARAARRGRRRRGSHHGIEERPVQDAFGSTGREIGGDRRAHPGTEMAEREESKFTP